MSDTIGQALIYAVLLILPLSALLARRLPLSMFVKYALAWVAVFAIGLLLVAGYRHLTSEDEPGTPPPTQTEMQFT